VGVVRDTLTVDYIGEVVVVCSFCIVGGHRYLLMIIYFGYIQKRKNEKMGMD